MCFESIISNILCVIVININPLFVVNQLNSTKIKYKSILVLDISFIVDYNKIVAGVVDFISFKL